MYDEIQTLLFYFLFSTFESKSLEFMHVDKQAFNEQWSNVRLKTKTNNNKKHNETVTYTQLNIPYNCMIRVVKWILFTDKCTRFWL